MSTWICTRQNELTHHGIKGMKWGVRRFQNKDGSLTKAGMIRYNDKNVRESVTIDGQTFNVTGKNKKKYADDLAKKAKASGATVSRSSKSKNNKTHYDDNEDIVIKKGSDIHRIVPKEWVENEKTYSGHAYATFKKEDTDRYKKFARMFGGGDNYVDMTFTAKEMIVSPSRKKRVDEFIKLMDSNPAARESLLKSTRKPMTFMPKKVLDNLDNPKNAEKAFRKFSYLLVSNRDLRDPYFKSLEKQGYTMVIDDADSMGGISKSPVIIFDRNKSLSLKSANRIGSEAEDRQVDLYKKEHPNTKMSDYEIMEMLRKNT